MLLTHPPDYYLELAEARAVCKCGAPLFDRKAKQCDQCKLHGKAKGPWHVYFLRSAALGMVKVGITRHDQLDRRIASLRSQGADGNLELLGTILTRSKRLETTILERFQHLRRPGSEWLRESQELRSYIDQVLSRTGPDPGPDPYPGLEAARTRGV